MRMSLTILAALALTATAATAAEDIMVPRFGNTIVVTNADGKQSRIYYNADHTFKASSGFLSIGGTWSLDGNKLCRKYSFTIPGRPNPECDPIVAHKVGETWSDGTSTFALVKGVQ